MDFFTAVPYGAAFFVFQPIVAIILKSNNMKIKHNDNEYEVKPNVKAMMVFEAITEKPFEIKNVTDFYTYCFSMIYANNTENVPEFDEFLEWFDDDEKLIEEFSKALTVKKPLESKDDKKKQKEKR